MVTGYFLRALPHTALQPERLISSPQEQESAAASMEIRAQYECSTPTVSAVRAQPLLMFRCHLALRKYPRVASRRQVDQHLLLSVLSRRFAARNCVQNTALFFHERTMDASVASSEDVVATSTALAFSILNPTCQRVLLLSAPSHTRAPAATGVPSELAAVLQQLSKDLPSLPRAGTRSCIELVVVALFAVLPTARGSTGASGGQRAAPRLSDRETELSLVCLSRAIGSVGSQFFIARQDRVDSVLLRYVA